MSSEELQRVLTNISPVSGHTAAKLLSATFTKKLRKGAHLEKSGQNVNYQFIVLEGIIRKYLIGPEGEDFSIGFFTKGQAITPALLRSIDFVSFVNLEVISPTAEILFFSYARMEETMDTNEDLKSFGFRVMMQDAFFRMEREKILLTATGLEKLNWFRKHFSNLENEIPHYYIASFLGLTPTSLSRLRKVR